MQIKELENVSININFSDIKRCAFTTWKNTNIIYGKLTICFLFIRIHYAPYYSYNTITGIFSRIQLISIFSFPEERMNVNKGDAYDTLNYKMKL